MWRRKHHRIHRAAGETLCFLEEWGRIETMQRSKKSIVSKLIHLEDYKNCLFTGKEQLQTKNIIRSRKHELFTEQVNKVALSSSDDKRIILPDRINNLSHGFRGWGQGGPREDRGALGKTERPWRRQGELGNRGFDRDFRKRRSNTEKYTTYKHSEILWI